MAESRWDNFWSGVATHANEAYGNVRQAGRSMVAHGEQAADYAANQGTRLAGVVERNTVAAVEKQMHELAEMTRLRALRGMMPPPDAPVGGVQIRLNNSDRL